MQLLTNETRIRRRKRPVGSKKKSLDPMRFLLVLLVLPLLLLIVLVSQTHNRHDNSNNSKPSNSNTLQQHYIISPDALRLRSQKILEGRRHKKDSFKSRLGSPDHKRQTHLRKDDNKQKETPALKPSPEAPKLLPPIHNHTIPNVLIFTHYINLLETDDLTGEDLALKANVQNSVDLHSDAQVLFLTDDDCLESIARVMGSNTPLLDFFRKESHGMYKADICRGAALYEHGGLYLDIDMQARMSLWSVIAPTSTFVVPFVHRESKHPGNFFQAFIGSVPKNPILKRYLELFIDHYEGKIDLQGPLGVLLLRKAHDDILGTPKHPKESDQVPQYFMEVLYDAQVFPDVPPPDWGVRRACHFVVVANAQSPYVVPFYSRVKGSRMCGGSDSEKKPVVDSK